MAKAKETYGPFDTYTEVDTSVGVFGVPQGFTLTVGDDGTVTREAAVIARPEPAPKAKATPKPKAATAKQKKATTEK